MPHQYEIDAAAKAICRAYFGDVVTHGDARCCQLGGLDGCCLPTMLPIAEAALRAAEELRNAPPIAIGSNASTAPGMQRGNCRHDKPLAEHCDECADDFRNAN